MAEVNEVVDYVESTENEIITDSKERFVIKVDDLKQSMGPWYSVFAVIILPFLLYIIPVNVVLGRLNFFVMGRLMPGVDLNGTPLLVMWIVVMLGFLAAAVFAPKVATVIEFILGFGYLFFAFRHHLFTNLLGYSVLIGMIIFLLVKLVFLVFALIRIKTFSKDDKTIERDESGRVVRAVEEEEYFTANDNEDEGIPISDDEVFFAANDENEQNAPVSDDDFFFVTNDENEQNTPVSDDDFFFG